MDVTSILTVFILTAVSTYILKPDTKPVPKYKYPPCEVCEWRQLKGKVVPVCERCEWHKLRAKVIPLD